MNDELEFILNRQRSSNFDTNFYTRIAEALAIDLERKRTNEEAGLQLDDPFLDENIEDYLPQEDGTSHVENDLTIEPNIGRRQWWRGEEYGSVTGEENNNCFTGKDGTIWNKN